jgi:4-hydroxy-3-methylbut-2-enyl diphosphate reductase
MAKKSASTKKKSPKKIRKTSVEKPTAGRASAKTVTLRKASSKKVSIDNASKASPRAKILKQPRTMEELLEQTGYELKGVKRGQLVEGTVTDVSKKMVLVDIGGKTEGLVVDKEYENAKDFISELSVGDTLTVYVLTPENDRGQILLSLKKAASDRTWQKFEEAHKTGEIMTVKGLEVNRGGVIVHADSVQGFVPSSQFGKQWLGKMEEIIDRSIQVRVIEVDREKNRLIFSEKQVSEADEIKQRGQALKKIKLGEVYSGIVSGVMPFGVFVTVDVPLENIKLKTKDSTAEKKRIADKKEKTIGKVEGLVHISEISWEKVDNPGQHFRVGDSVKVSVLGIDETSGKLNLSVKRLSKDPWDGIEKKYPSGTKVKGKVSRVAPFGAFVTLEPGIEGLMHISKIPAGEEPEVGDAFEVFVEQVDPEHRRMSLGKVLTEVPVGYK